jgi:hypothetical protein
MKKHFFTINNCKVPFIHGGSVESLGSSLSASFNGSFSFNPNTSKSTDILFMQLALGEGPIYRINSNGPQDIEIDDKYIDDLVDFNTNNTKTDVLVARYATGTFEQKPMPAFFNESVNSIRFSSPIQLKSGISSSDIPAPLKTSIQFFPTSVSEDLLPIDSIRFKFMVRDLRVEQNSGAEPGTLSLLAIIHPRNETSSVTNYIAANGTIINSLVQGSMAVEVEVKIPDELKKSEGYRVSMLKLSDDVAEEGYIAEVEAIGFDEIRKEQYAYPGTALAGYAIKSTEFRTEELPTITSLVKGLIVEVPSNYNQPILESGEVDWRQVELPISGDFSPSVAGYRTQSNPTTIVYDYPINIYKGVWDGTFKKDWTENRVWIIRHILVNILGIPSENIDKYNFYNVAQYLDAVDSATGNFIGVDGFSDGSFRYKPNGYLTDIPNSLLGLPEGILIKERRFVCGISITDRLNAWDLVTSLAAGIRAVIHTNGSKIRLIIDKANNFPVAVFNETNIQEKSFKLSGVKEEDIPTGVEVSYIDLLDHYRKTSVVLDSSEILEEDRDKRISIDAIGCNRRSEALRLANYHLSTQRSIKRRATFTASYDASDLEIGDVISVSNKLSGVSYGFGGQVFSNSTVASDEVFLEHLAYPSMDDSLFTSNTNPLLLKLFSQKNNKLDYYIIDNAPGSYEFIATGNTISGYDVLKVSILKKLEQTSKVFQNNTSFSTITAPDKNDLWAIGEIDPNNIYEDSSSKLFKIESLTFGEQTVSIVSSEYSSELLESIDSSAIFSQNKLTDNQNYITPPIPVLNLKSIPQKTNEGIVSYNMLVSATTDTSQYLVPVTTHIRYGVVPTVLEVVSQIVKMPVDQQEFTIPGTYSWIAPADVTAVSVVCVGAGGGPAANASGASGAGGGGLGWKNNIPVIPGQSYTVTVGTGGARVVSGTAPAGGNSFFIATSTVAGLGGLGGICASNANRAGGSFVGDGGGNGGAGGSRSGSTAAAGGGGGAGGYSGTGGAGGNANETAGTLAGSGSGGGGGGGGRGGSVDSAGSGGGVGIYGQGTNGSGGANSGADGGSGFGGSGGEDGNVASTSALTDIYSISNLSTPGKFGGGGCGADNTVNEQAPGANGAVRIIWGLNRIFPSTNTIDL